MLAGGVTVAAAQEQQPQGGQRGGGGRMMSALMQGFTLSADQQAKFDVIAKKYADARQTTMHDQSLDEDARRARMREAMAKQADEIKALLTESRRSARQELGGRASANAAGWRKASVAVARSGRCRNGNGRGDVSLGAHSHFRFRLRRFLFIMRGEFLDLNGARLYYYAAGSRGAGEPIVLLHGFPTSGHLWSGVVPLLPAGHRVVVLDLLGYGRSDPPKSRGVDLRSHADRLIAVLDHLGINFACLVGHDIGGGVAQSVAIRHPHRVSRLCLVNAVAFGEWPTREVRLARAMLPLTRHLPPSWILSIVRADLLRGYVDHDHGSRDIDLYLRPFVETEGRDALMTHLLGLDCAETQGLAARLKEIVSPTAVVWGEHDPFLPASIGQRLRSTIPGSTLEIIPDTRHFVPVEAPHRVASAVAQLLSR